MVQADSNPTTHAKSRAIVSLRPEACLEPQAATEVLRYDKTRSSLHHEGGTGESAAARSMAECLQGPKLRPVAPG